MGEQAEELKARTRRFALAVMEYVEMLPQDVSTRHLAGQLLRAANGVASNYRATCRSRSRAEFVARMGVVAEEADESAHWLDVLVDRRCEPLKTGQKLQTEAHALMAIFSASYGTSKRNLKG